MSTNIKRDMDPEYMNPDMDYEDDDDVESFRGRRGRRGRRFRRGRGAFGPGLHRGRFFPGYFRPYGYFGGYGYGYGGYPYSYGYASRPWYASGGCQEAQCPEGKPDCDVGEKVCSGGTQVRYSNVTGDKYCCPYY